MDKMDYLEGKKAEILQELKLICEAFGISDYDYIIKDTEQTETLRIDDVKIGCSCNSVSAVVDELIGYIFITRWCRNRSLGTFSTQAKNQIKRYWIKEVE